MNSTLGAGAIIAAKYQVVRVIGEGGMGTVYEAIHTKLRQRVAIKMLHANLAAHPELVERFEREARAAATIDSPNVAKVMDVDQTVEGIPYMVIELLEGHDLSVELEQRLQLPVDEAVGWVMEACAPIAHAHSLGIIHRDLKPSNLFIAKKGKDRVLKLLDFGISKVITESSAKITSSYHALGTPHYMSPEQVRRAANVDTRADIWALGVILYELLTGTVPFPDEPTAAIAAIAADDIVPPRQLRRDIPDKLDAIIMRALEKDPKKRFQSARELSSALAEFAPEEELVAVSRRDSLPDTYEVTAQTLPPPSNPGATPIPITPVPLTPVLSTPVPMTPVSISRPPATTTGGLSAARDSRAPKKKSVRAIAIGGTVAAAAIVTLVAVRSRHPDSPHAAAGAAAAVASTSPHVVDAPVSVPPATTPAVSVEDVVTPPAVRTADMSPRTPVSTAPLRKKSAPAPSASPSAAPSASAAPPAPKPTNPVFL